MVYTFKAGSHLYGDAQKLGEHLEGLRLANGGLTSRLVVDDAKADESPLHDYLTWDNEEAGDRLRMIEANHVLNCIVVTNGDGRLQEPTRAFVVVTLNDEQHYTSVQALLANPALMDQVLARALRELEVFEKKYNAYQELSGVIAEARAVRQKLRPS